MSDPYKELTEMMLEDAKKYGEITKDGEIKIQGKVMGQIKQEEPKQSLTIFGIQGQVEEFYKLNHFFYDKAGMFWIWEENNKRYVLSDEVDMLNGLNELGINTITARTKTEIINAIKQYGRKKIPKDSPLTWVQFKDKITDFETGEIFDASPDYFITNPIPFNVGENSETPNMDRLFEEWVGKEYVDTLYEIIAYSCSSHQFMQRLIALVGGGANGKGTFLQLLSHFLGRDNVVTSDLREISNNQFESSALYRKLLCVLGEINYGDLKSTNQIKKLSGEDLIRYCFKGKTPFSEKSITTVISATNALPMTPDKTVGFYRRWLIIDFPNRFDIKQGIVESIPEEEYNNLANKVIFILRDLFKRQKFTNEGNLDERAKKYEERSNPIMDYIENYCEESEEGYISLKKFANVLNAYLSERHLRIINAKEIKRRLNEEGFEVRRTTKFGMTDTFILNLKPKSHI